MVRYTSSELFHLVGRASPEDHDANYQTLLKVLDSRQVSHPPHHHQCNERLSFNWNESLLNEKLVLPEITCFCDIPYEALEVHMRKYGMFGVSFAREYLVKYGARPAIYVPLQPSDPLRGWGTIFCEAFLIDVEQVWRGVHEQYPETNEPPGFSSRSCFLKAAKPKTAASYKRSA
jgi:Putative abortive phage resistance protein AbiGi, antitoxin